MRRSYKCGKFSGMDFKSYLKLSANQVDQALDQILSEFLNEVKKKNPKLIPFALGLINSCKGGKRIRGVLCKFGYELAMSNVKFQMSNDILKISAAFEILHAAILIHDDIADQSPTRRDQPSLYQALGGDHYGISQAINIGDIGLYLPIKIITDSSFLGEYRLKALSLLSRVIVNTGWGQVMDIDLSSGKQEFSSQLKEFIDLNKTAKYTISAPLQIGAILGGAEEKLLRELEDFGEKLGIAFQIQDDILDGEAGLVADAKSKALEYAVKSKKEISKITSNDKIRKLLEGMCQFMVERSK